MLRILGVGPGIEARISYRLVGPVVPKIRHRRQIMKDIALDVARVGTDVLLAKVYTVIARFASISPRVAEAFYGMDWRSYVFPLPWGARGLVHGHQRAGVAPIAGYISGKAADRPYPIHELALRDLERSINSGSMRQFIVQTIKRYWKD